MEVHYVDECPANAPTYRASSGFSPLYVMTSIDERPRFITVWTSGSSYWVVVYEIGAHKITKVLEQGTRARPVVSVSRDGDEHLELCDEHGCRHVRGMVVTTSQPRLATHRREKVAVTTDPWQSFKPKMNRYDDA